MIKGCRKNKKGFTLVEFVVVMAVMAILTAVAVPMLTSSSDSKTKEKYKQYCVSVLDSALSIAEAYSKGASSVAGYEIAKNTGEPNWDGINQCLNADNPYNYKFKVDCLKNHYTLSDFNKLSGGYNPNGNDYRNIDTVVVCFVYNDLERTITPVGGWFIKKAVSSPAFKYDNIMGKGIDLNQKFTLPD